MWDERGGWGGSVKVWGNTFNDKEWEVSQVRSDSSSTMWPAVQGGNGASCSYLLIHRASHPYGQAA